MCPIKWETLNDYVFVHLVAELLRRRGFIDVEVQGSGPDGGLDLIATELLSFGLAGPRAFRWGIQCKFSVTGTRSSVTDSDVRDVEGILRADRFAGQELRGYMLVTNRKIAQNVVERLRGIDRRAIFRATWIDGAQFQELLSECPPLLHKYFSEISLLTHYLGDPILVSEVTEAGFVVEVGVGLPSRTPTMETIRVKALLDTGAAITAVPAAVLYQLGAQPINSVAIETSSGSVRWGVYSARFDFGAFEMIVARVLSWDNHFAMIGRDILDEMVVLIHGPNRVATFWRGRI